MNYLAKYLPAENWLIIKGPSATSQQLYRLTFMHLLVKQVLEITTETRAIDSRGTAVVYKYVVRGKNFEAYKPQPHEQVYLSPFYKSSSIRILLKHLLTMGAENGGDTRFISAVRKSPAVEQYFTRGTLEKIFGGFTVTQQGVQVRLQIKDEVAQLEKDLGYVVTDKEKARNVLNRIGGNILLLTAINWAALELLDKEVHAEMTKKHHDDGSWSYGGGCGGSGDGHGHSGCGGHSGCSSGCSGCGGGGCGGCGS